MLILFRPSLIKFVSDIYISINLNFIKFNKLIYLKFELLSNLTNIGKIKIKSDLFMNMNEKKFFKLEELKNIQQSFEESIKILEKNVAESVINKNKIEEIKKDLREANQKFSDAEKCLDDLTIELNNNLNPSDTLD